MIFYAQQAVRWQKRKAELQELKARALMQCMDAFLKVVTVNFKVQIAPGVVQDIKGHMYTSLMDSGPPRGIAAHCNILQHTATQCGARY